MTNNQKDELQKSYLIYCSENEADNEIVIRYKKKVDEWEEADMSGCGDEER